jgi:hypothetical protein
MFLTCSKLTIFCGFNQITRLSPAYQETNVVLILSDRISLICCPFEEIEFMRQHQDVWQTDGIDRVRMVRKSQKKISDLSRSQKPTQSQPSLFCSLLPLAPLGVSQRIPSFGRREMPMNGEPIGLDRDDKSEWFARGLRSLPPSEAAQASTEPSVSAPINLRHHWLCSHSGDGVCDITTWRAGAARLDFDVAMDIH